MGEASSTGSATAVDERRPPGPPVGRMNLVRSRRNPLGFMRDVATYGDVTCFTLGPKDIYLITHPDYVGDIMVMNHRKFGPPKAFPIMGLGLLTSEGDYHKKQRRLVQPVFHHTRIAEYAETMAGIAERVNARWRDGHPVDIRHEMTDLALAIVMQTLFDTEIERHNVHEVRVALETITTLNAQGGAAFGKLDPASAVKSPEFKEALRVFDAFIYNVIEERRRHAGGRDLLTMLMEARYEDGTGMNDEQLRDEAVALVGAGHETLANGLAWAFYLVAQHPEVQAKLRDEVRAVAGRGALDWTAVSALDYTEKVFAESMRLYPPVPFSSRRSREEHEVGGYVIPADAKLLLGQFIVHRDPRWWPEPERFDPERWTEEAGRSRHRYAYFPFGGGPRLCIGESFAWLEAKIILATVVRSWHFTLESDPDVQGLPWTTLRPASPIELRVSAVA